MKDTLPPSKGPQTTSYDSPTWLTRYLEGWGTAWMGRHCQAALHTDGATLIKQLANYVDNRDLHTHAHKQ